MTDQLTAFEEAAETFSSAPSMGEMPRRTLQDKGIGGPTAAHVIEELHTPFNLAYVTFTTGSSAFQNIVGVTHTEIEGRCAVARRLFEKLGVESGARMLVTYPPLVNVFSQEALKRSGIEWFFLNRSARDSFIAKFCREKPSIILGESSFVRASLEEAKRLGLEGFFPKNCIIIAAGTPLDHDLIPVAEAYGFAVHDLYGCQEFGWLTLDGVELRDDLSLIPSPRGENYRELVVGGLPMGDSFIVSPSGHVCNPDGKIITYRRERTYPEYEVIVKATTFAAAQTVEKAARTTLRIKGRVVKVAVDLVTSADATRLVLVPGLPLPGGAPVDEIHITGPDKTQMFDSIVQAQADFQKTSKTDPVWHKRR